MMNRTLPLLLPSMRRSSLGRPKWLQRKTHRRKRKCHPWREEQSIIVTASRPPLRPFLLVAAILCGLLTAGTLVRSEALTPSVVAAERRTTEATATDNTSPPLLSNLNLANSSDRLSPLNQSIITSRTTTANTLINCSDAMTKCHPVLSSGRVEEVKRTANASVTSLLPSSSSSFFSGHSATVTDAHRSFLHSLLPSSSSSFSGASALVPTRTAISTNISTFSSSSSSSSSSLSSFSSAFPSTSSSPSSSFSSIASLPNRTHSVQLININQSDAVKRVRSPVLAATTAVATTALSTALGSVHLPSSGNRVNLTDNVSRQTNSINGTTSVVPSGLSAWAPALLLLSGANNNNNNNNNNNVTRQTSAGGDVDAAESDDDLALLANDQQQQQQQPATDGDDGREEEKHLHANLSSSVDAASISSNWRCANLSFAYPSYSTRTSITKTTASELVAKSNDNNTDKNRSSTSIIISHSSLDKLLASVSNKVDVNFERESATNESITGSRPGDCSSSSLPSLQSAAAERHWPLNDTGAGVASGGQKLAFSHMHDDSLSVSAVIDAIATPSSALLSAAPAEQSAGGTRAGEEAGTGAAGPLAPSTLSEHHQLDTNSYYRYSSRDNDPSVLLSRYPSLRLPPPPPEFADDFNEGITEITAVAGTSVEIPCNTSIWEENEVSLVLWFRGDTGVPIYRVDARSDTLSKAKHTSADELRKRFHFDISLKLPVLRISPVLPSDAAEYRCRVDFRQSRTQNVLVALNVTVPPKELLIMDVEGQKLEGVIGPYDENSNVLLICEAEGGKPSPEVNWYSGSRLLDSSYTVGPHGLVRNELNIRALNRSDFMSILTCRAWNNNVTEPISSTVILDMNLRPLDVKILTKSTPTISSSKVTSFSSVSSSSGHSSPAIVLAAGSKAEFQCRSIGSRPSAQISWWLGPERLSSNVRDSVNEDGNATISTITFVPDLEDNGKMLTCRADNLPMPHTALKDEKLLNVHFAPQLRISFGSNIGRDSIREGSDVYLECRVRANPPVKEVVWLHEGRPLHGSLTGDVNAADASRSTIIMTNQSLVIQKVHRSHRGRYQCVAFNDQGETVSEALMLKVNFAPVCVDGQKTQYGVSRNEQIRIRCEVDAEPSLGLTFRWTLNASGSETSTEWASFTNNATTSIATYRPESSLDYGTLSCVAQNSIGQQVEACVYSVVPAGRPDPVRSCAITNHSMSTLLVECAAGDDGGLRQQFSLEVFAATTQQRVDNQTNSTPNFLVNRLTPGTQYSLVLYAFNAKGRSHSVSLSAVTLSPPEKHMSSRVGLASSFEQIVVHPVLAILIGIVAAIVLVILLIIFLIKSRHNRFQLAQQRNGPNDSCSGLNLNGDLKMKKVKINGTNGKIVSNGKKPHNGDFGKDGSTTNGDLVSNASPSKYSTDGQKLGLAAGHDNADPSNESSAVLLTSSSAMNGGSLPPCSENMSSSLALASLVHCDTLMMPTRPTSTSEHSSSSAATTAPLSDLMGPNGQTLYGVAGDSCSVMHQQQHCNSGKLQSPSHQSSGCRVMPTNVRHLVDLSSGSTCCSSSTSSSPHTLMQGPPPPVPSLPASLAQGVLFAPGELTEAVGGGGSPGHYGSQHSNQQHQQYATQQYHPYLMSTSAAQHLATLPRHYEASMATLTSPMKLYSEDQLVHPSALYESQYTPVIVNSIDPSYHQSHLGAVQHQHGQPLLYYNTGGSSSSSTAATGNSSPMGASLLEHGAAFVDANKTQTQGHPSVFHHSHHMKTSAQGAAASQTLPRRCSVGPLESTGNSTAVDGLYISFSKAPVKGVNLQAKNYSSPMTATKGGSSHVDCVQTSASSVPLESVPLLGPSTDQQANNGSLDQQQQQGNLPSPRPHQICLASSPRKGATAV